MTVDIQAVPADELRPVAIAADVFLLIASARAYGLVDGGPEINVARCEEIIDAAHNRGIRWSDDDRDTALAVILAQLTSPNTADQARDLVDIRERAPRKLDGTPRAAGDAFEPRCAVLMARPAQLGGPVRCQLPAEHAPFPCIFMGAEGAA